MNLLLLACAVAVPPAWQFVDSAELGSRSVLTYRSVEFSDTPSRPIHKDDKVPSGTRFGSIAIGPGGMTRQGLVWHEATNRLWFDANGDGRFNAEERHTLAMAPTAVKVEIPFGEDRLLTRTVLFRKRGNGVAWAVRGHTTGSITITGHTYRAALTDGNADGTFDTPGSDRIWIDLDNNGTFDPLTEQFLLGQAITLKGVPVLIQPQADGLGAIARVRPNEVGTLQFDLWRQSQTTVAEIAINLVSEFGELVVVKSVDAPLKLPVGKYHLDAVQMTLADATGKLWAYQFNSSRRQYDITISRNKSTLQPLLANPRVEVHVDNNGVRPDTTTIVSGNVLSGNLYLTSCNEIYNLTDQFGKSVLAEIKLTEPGSVVIERANTGFL